VTQVVICCGVGGVGKTTISAALGVAFAMTGRRTVVLTIDPARRLASALGLEHLGNAPRRLPAPTPDAAPLDALMLDRKATWDEVVRRHAPDEATADRLLVNRYYRALSERLTGGHEYMATEKLHALVTAGAHDVVVVDTPPSQQALDFFRAPDRVRRVLEPRTLAAILQPRGGLWGEATRRLVGVLRRLAGAAVIDDLAEFLGLLSSLSVGFRERGAAMRALLTGPSTTYLLVADATAPRTDEMLAFMGALRERDHRFGGTVVNRFAAPLVHDLDTLKGALPEAPAGVDADAWARACEAALDVARRQRDRHRDTDGVLERLRSAGAGPFWTVPDLGRGIADLDDLVAVAARLPPLAAGA
jgi:anion-transporting  ArsA/GET3 family ATPase